MWPESEEEPKPLKTGLTTGCCATACCVAAAEFLLGENKLDVVSVTLPKGQVVELKIVELKIVELNNIESASASIKADGEKIQKTQGTIPNDCACKMVRTSTIKDAGDDPDVTHQATIFVELTPIKSKAIRFVAGKGVGTVTREGLVIAVGEPAINPVPRRMMIEHLQSIAKKYDYSQGFEVSVGVVNGEKIALKTMNARLGIMNGLSILGTTGIVRPFSCSAYIASIHQGIDVATTNGHQHIAASTGNQSEVAIKSIYPLPDMALIEMGDFVGAVLKYLKKVPVEKLTLCGGFGKLTKLAQGHLDLHSSRSSIDFKFLAQLAEKQGASNDLLQEIKEANTSLQALKACEENHIDLGTSICQKALIKILSIVPKGIEVEVWAINRQGEFIAKVSSLDRNEMIEETEH